MQGLGEIPLLGPLLLQGLGNMNWGGQPLQPGTTYPLVGATPNQGGQPFNPYTGQLGPTRAEQEQNRADYWNAVRAKEAKTKTPLDIVSGLLGGALGIHPGVGAVPVNIIGQVVPVGSPDAVAMTDANGIIQVDAQGHPVEPGSPDAVGERPADIPVPTARPDMPQWLLDLGQKLQWSLGASANQAPIGQGAIPSYLASWLTPEQWFGNPDLLHGAPGFAPTVPAYAGLPPPEKPKPKGWWDYGGGGGGSYTPKWTGALTRWVVRR
jgi:hypothetical protein